MGMTDMREYIQFILDKTGSEKLGYVGYSQGTTQMLAALSLDAPFFQEKVSAIALLAPVAKLDDQNLFFNIGAKYHLAEVLKKIWIYELFPWNYTQNKVWAWICDKLSFVCELGSMIFAGKHPEYENQEKYEVFFSHAPAGTSVKEFEAYTQIIRADKFIQWRSSMDDPEVIYELEKIPADINIGLFVGLEDELGNIESNRWLKDQLSHLGSLKFYKEYEKMGHLTFMLPLFTFDYLLDTHTFLQKYYI